MVYVRHHVLLNDFSLYESLDVGMHVGSKLRQQQLFHLVRYRKQCRLK
ncbi:hypothetical protein NT06LI_2935 [Listeria innocua FSL J1-023]|nr:hypothetical protein NT06LI_2935 [Listeria innocua FSL J1-023]